MFIRIQYNLHKPQCLTPLLCSEATSVNNVQFLVRLAFRCIALRFINQL